MITKIKDLRVKIILFLKDKGVSRELAVAINVQANKKRPTFCRAFLNLIWPFIVKYDVYSGIIAAWRFTAALAASGKTG